MWNRRLLYSYCIVFQRSIQSQWNICNEMWFKLLFKDINQFIQDWSPMPMLNYEHTYQLCTYNIYVIAPELCILSQMKSLSMNKPCTRTWVRGKHISAAACVWWQLALNRKPNLFGMYKKSRFCARMVFYFGAIERNAHEHIEYNRGLFMSFLALFTHIGIYTHTHALFI